jgi:tape measure domain-containing protein
MSALSVTLGIDITSLRRGLAAAANAVSATAAQMRKVGAAGMAGIGNAGVAGLKASIGVAMAGAGAAVGVGIKSVMAAADFESTKMAFTTMIGDAAKAETTLAQLRKLGAETPFEFPELADAGRKLIAFGEGSDTVAETLRRIGDVSAGVQAPIGEIAEIYGKARVQGRLFAEDINQLTGRGIPIIGQLAKQFGVSDGEVKKLVETGQVGFPQIEQAFMSMTGKGGQFHGMMAAQSKTTSGLFSTLKDSFNEVFLALGQPINDALRPMIEQAIGLVAKLAPMAAEAGKRIKEGLQFVVATFKSGQVINLITAALKLGFAEGVNGLVSGFRYAVSFFYSLMMNGSFWQGIGALLIGVAAGLGAAMLEAMAMPINFLKTGIDEVLGMLLKGLLKIPGMEQLLGFGANEIDAVNQENLDRRRNEGVSVFGVKSKELMDAATAITKNGAGFIGDAVSQAAGEAGKFGGGMGVIDTNGLRSDVQGIVASIKEVMPKPEEVTQSAKAASSVTGAAQTAAQAARLEPIITSLGRVGGGGYGSGTLDAQRENNKLTGQTNVLLTAIRDKLTGKAGSPVGTFG